MNSVVVHISDNRYNLYMDLKQNLKEKHLTSYQLCKKTNLPITTISDLTSGRSSLQNARGRTLIAIAKALSITVDELLSFEEIKGADNLPVNKRYLEKDLPYMLKQSLLQYKRGLRRVRDGEKYFQLDIDYGELQSSINSAEVEQEISKETANYLREKYLFYEKGGY